MTIPKYRAWHKEHRTMKPVLELDLDPANGVFVASQQPENDDSQYNTYGEYWLWREIELMQWTGLQDCTGKDIYQGDIIRTDNEQEGDEPAEDHFYGVVIYDHQRTGYFIKQPHDKYSPALYNYYIVSIEVVGNIYQHHELLEQQP